MLAAFRRVGVRFATRRAARAGARALNTDGLSGPIGGYPEASRPKLFIPGASPGVCGCAVLSQATKNGTTSLVRERALGERGKAAPECCSPASSAL